MKKNSGNSRFFLRLQWLLVVALVLYGLFQPQPPPHIFFPYDDKYQHVLAFAGLMISSLLLWNERILRVTLIGLVLAVFAELVQPLVSLHRYGSISDGIANVCGVLLGVLSVVIWQRYWRK